MSKTYQHIFKSIVAVIFATMLFSCQNRLNTVRKWEQDFNKPQTSGKGMNLFYTDSGAVKANLRSPNLLDYTQKTFPYREFPDGLEVDFFNEKNQKSTIIADYGIIYNATGLVDLRGNVKITTSDSTVLYADQLYWNQEENWVFSDINYTIELNNGAINKGEGFDANEKFDKFISRSNVGIQYIDESEQ